MMPYHIATVGRYRLAEARLAADRRRLRRTARTGVAGAYGAGVIDALGHGLIALGARLVADREQHPHHRRAA